MEENSVNSDASEKRKLSAIMFTDIKGFSKRMGEDEEGTFRLLKEQMQSVNPIIEKYDGRVVKTIGDAIMGDFASVLNAVKCAVDIQKLLHRTNQNRSEQEKLIIRIGIHLGDVILSENDLYGDGVNIAARLEGIAPPGGISVSEIVYSSVRSQLPLNFQDTGLKSLKNIKEPMRVYSIPPIPSPAVKSKDDTSEVAEKVADEVDLSDPAMRFKNHLENMEIEEAISAAKREKINEKLVKNIVKQVMHSLSGQKEFRKAIKLGKGFSFTNNELYSQIKGEFEKLFKSGQFEDAAMWGLEYKLPNEDLLQAVKKFFIDLVGKAASIQEFQKFFDNFKSMKKNLADVAVREFKNLYSMEKYDLCIFLGKQFNIMGKEVSEIALKALVQELEKSNLVRVESLIKEYNIFSDNMFQPIENENVKKKLGNLFLDKYVLPRLKKGDFEDLNKKLQEFNFFNVKFYDKYLNAIQDEIIGNAVSMHNKLMENDNFKIAKILKDVFDLLNKHERFKGKIIETAEKYHNSLLKTNKFDLAIIVKNEYKLFVAGKEDINFEDLYNSISTFAIATINKGDFGTVEKALKEYNIPKPARGKMFKSILIDSFKKGEYETVFKIMDFANIKLAQKDLGDEIMNSFKLLMSENKYEFAAKLYQKFGLNKLLIEDMVVKSWKIEMKKGNYETAFKIKKDFNLQKKFIYGIVRGLYEKNIAKKNFKDAYSLRQQYGLKIGISEWFKEVFVKLFG
jgi:class 3 adenylate cyclase